MIPQGSYIGNATYYILISQFRYANKKASGFYYIKNLTQLIKMEQQFSYSFGFQKFGGDYPIIKIHEKTPKRSDVNIYPSIEDLKFAMRNIKHVGRVEFAPANFGDPDIKISMDYPHLPFKWEDFENTINLIKTKNFVHHSSMFSVRTPNNIISYDKETQPYVKFLEKLKIDIFFADIWEGKETHLTKVCCKNNGVTKFRELFNSSFPEYSEHRYKPYPKG